MTTAKRARCFCGCSPARNILRRRPADLTGPPVANPLAEVHFAATDILKLDVLRRIKILVIWAERLPGRQDTDRARINQKSVRRPAPHRRASVEAIRQA
jgi:hypothetical protein